MTADGCEERGSSSSFLPLFRVEGGRLASLREKTERRRFAAPLKVPGARRARQRSGANYGGVRAAVSRDVVTPIRELVAKLAADSLTPDQWDHLNDNADSWWSTAGSIEVFTT